MKLIQKTRWFESHEYQLFEDQVIFTRKTPFNQKKTTILLDQLDPEPEVNNSESTLVFRGLYEAGQLISFRLNKPDSREFHSFVNAVIEKIIQRAKTGEEHGSTIKAYSQRLTPPFSGLVQIAESNRARALTMDGKNWEFQYLHIMLSTEGDPGKSYRRRYSHALTVDKAGLQEIVSRASQNDIELDESLIELANFISEADFPFPSTDIYEYWLLDKEDESPLAMIFSCSEPEQMATFPTKNEWTSLPASAMPVVLTDEEVENNETPVNRRVEQMVNERAGLFNAKARWFKRGPGETEIFPPLLLAENWEDAHQADLCQRYLSRQSSRLLMLHNLSTADRQRLEIEAKSHVFEVERFHHYYPEIVDQKIINTILVEAVLRKNNEKPDPSSVENRRDGVLYL